MDQVRRGLEPRAGLGTHGTLLLIDANMAPLKLRVLTGDPGSGKSRVANHLLQSFSADWALLHADDFIGPTLRIFDRPWPEVRVYHPFWLGWSVGWNLHHGRNVLVEGHLRTPEEIGWLRRGVGDGFQGELDVKVGYLSADLEAIVEGLRANPYREPSWSGTDRAERFRDWVLASAVDPTVADVRIDARTKSVNQLAREVAVALDLPLPP